MAKVNKYKVACVCISSYSFTSIPLELFRYLGYGLKVLFVCFVALRPKSTAMVIAGRSVHLTTLFPGQA